jgi:hypothetical protein
MPRKSPHPRVAPNDRCVNKIRLFRIGPLTFNFRRSGLCTVVLLASVLAPGQKTPSESVPSTRVSAATPAIVIGFVGGFIKHDNPVHSEVQLAARLRKEYPSGVEVETFESYHRGGARAKVLAILDTDHDGKLSAREKRNAHIIIYGHSWGGSQAVALARDLDKLGIPVLLTIQVDSVSRVHHNDAVIPANVSEAANYYQPSGLLHGQNKIRAADPAKTKILGNFRFDYKSQHYNCDKYPWYDRLIAKAHTQIECDPTVWQQAEDLIRSKLPVTSASGPPQ